MLLHPYIWEVAWQKRGQEEAGITKNWEPRQQNLAIANTKDWKSIIVRYSKPPNLLPHVYFLE